MAPLAVVFLFATFLAEQQDFTAAVVAAQVDFSEVEVATVLAEQAVVLASVEQALVFTVSEHVLVAAVAEHVLVLVVAGALVLLAQHCSPACSEVIVAKAANVKQTRSFFISSLSCTKLLVFLRGPYTTSTDQVKVQIPTV